MAMTQIKARFIMRLAKSLKEHDPFLAAELEMLVAGAQNSPHPRPTITADSLGAAFKKAREKLMVEGIDYALAGGLANKYWVDVRQTLDLDFMLQTDALEKVKALFPGGRDLPLMYSVRINGIDLDFLKGNIFPWTEEALKAAQVAPEWDVKVLTPEFLLLYKLRAGRERDLSDVKSMLTLREVEDKARDLVNRFMPDELDAFEVLVREAEYGV